MTNDFEPRVLEENTARLLQVALGPDTLPRPQLRQQTLGRLLAELRGRPAPVAFPDAVLVLLGGLLAVAACGLVLLGTAGQALSSANPVLLLFAAGLVLNFALMPVSGIVIVLGRQHEQTS
jgi:hypothetical protein